MSIINFSNIKAIKDYLTFKNKNILGSGNSIAADASLQSEIFNVKSSFINVNVRFGASTSSTAKVSIQVTCYNDEDIAVFTTEEEFVERFNNGTYYVKQYSIPTKRVMITLKNYDAVSLSGAVVNYSEIDRISKFEHQLTGIKTFAVGDNITSKIKVNKSALNLSMFWVTEPTSYTVYARFYDNGGNIVSINTVHIGTAANSSLRRVVSTPANTELVDFNIQLGAGTTGQIRSFVAKEVDTALNPSVSLSDNTVKIDRNPDKSILVFGGTAINAGASVTSAKLDLLSTNNLLNLEWTVRPLFFKVEAIFYRSTTVVDTIELYDRRLGNSLTYYKAFFQKLADVVEIKITNTSTANATLKYCTIIQQDGVIIDDTWENVYERLNQSIKSTIQKESAGFDEFYSAWRMQAVYRPDFFNSVFSSSVKNNSTAINDYFFLQPGVKQVRVYLRISNIQGSPFSTGQGAKLTIKAGDKDIEKQILESSSLQNGDHLLLLGVKDESITSTPLLFGDRLKFELSFTGTIDTSNYFTYELFTYSKY